MVLGDTSRLIDSCSSQRREPVQGRKDFRRAGFCLSHSGRPPGSLRHSGKKRHHAYFNCCEREKIIDFNHPSCLIMMNQVDQFCVIEVDQFCVIVPIMSNILN